MHRAALNSPSPLCYNPLQMGKASRKKKAAEEQAPASGRGQVHIGSPGATGLLWLGGAVVIVLYVLIRINLVDIPLDRDEGAFGYTGQVIANSGLPYRDAVDHKPPVIFYLYSLALMFVPPTSRGIHLFLHAYNFLTLVTVFFLARVAFRSSSAALWSAFVYALFSSSPLIQGFTASTEMFMLLPISLSILFAVLSVRNNSALYAVLSGISGALACWTKQVAVFSAAFGLLTMAAAWLGQRRAPSEEKPAVSGMLLLWWFCGAVGLSLLIGGYFYARGIFSQFYYWSFTHNMDYAARISFREKASGLLGWLRDLLRADFFIVGAGLAYGIYAAFRKDRRGYFALGFCLLSFLGTVPGFAYHHYFAQLAPAIAVAAGFALSELTGSAPARWRTAIILATAALVLSLPLYQNRGFYLEKDPMKTSRNFFGSNPFPESPDIADYLSRNSGPQDRVFIFGSEPQILFYARRLSPAPFTMLYPLTFAHPRNREMQETAWKDIEGSKPKFVLHIKLPTSILWDGKAEQYLAKNLGALLDREYALDMKRAINGTDRIFVYKRKEG